MFVYTFLTRFALRLTGFGAVVLLLSACAGRPTPSATPTSPTAATLPAPSPTTVTATATPFAVTPTTMPVPTTPVESKPPTAPVDWAAFESRTADGFYERGNPDAPILIRDYSDFL